MNFLVNKTSTKEEFERYYEAINKFVMRIKEKRMQDLQSNPFKAKAEEPDEQGIVIPTLDSLINTSKAEGFDNMFAKQNQIGSTHNPTSPQHPQAGANSGNGANTGMKFEFGSSGLAGNSQQIPANAFDSFNNFSTTPSSQNSTPTSMSFGNDTHTFGGGISTGMPGLPKAPEKKEPATLGGHQPPNQIKTPGGVGGGFNDFDKAFGGLSSLTGGSGHSLGAAAQKKPQATNGMSSQSMGGSMGGFNSGAGFGSKPNYDAFDDIVLNNDDAMPAPQNQGNTFGGGLGNHPMNMSASQTGGNMGNFGMSSNIQGNTMMGSNTTFGLTSNQQKQSSDPFQRGMGGLMMSQNDDLFAGLGGSSNTGLGNLGGGGMGTMGTGFGGLGSNQNTMGNSFGSMNPQGSMGSFGGMNTTLGGMGSTSQGMGGMSGMGGMGMGFGQPSMSTQQTKPGGMFSNPNLTIKTPQQQTNQQAGKSNNFNEFDLL